MHLMLKTLFGKMVMNFTHFPGLSGKVPDLDKAFFDEGVKQVIGLAEGDPEPVRKLALGKRGLRFYFFDDQ